jgi:hypothetical protein
VNIFLHLNRINGIDNRHEEEDISVRRSFVVEFQHRGTGSAILSGWSATATASSSPPPSPSQTTTTTTATATTTAVRSKRFVAHGHLNPGL